MANNLQLNFSVNLENAKAAFAALTETFKKIKLGDQITKDIENEVKKIEKIIENLSKKKIDIQTASPADAKKYMQDVKELETGNKKLVDLINQQTQAYLTQQGISAGTIKDIESKIQRNQNIIQQEQEKIALAQQTINLIGKSAEADQRTLVTRQGMIESAKRILADEKATAEQKQKAAAQLQHSQKLLDEVNQRNKERLEATKQIEEAEKKVTKAQTTIAANTQTLDVKREEVKLYKEIEGAVEKTTNVTKNYHQVSRQAYQDINKGAEQKRQNMDAVSATVTTLTDKMKRLVEFTIAAFALRQLRRFAQETLRFVADLDKSLTEIATVTGRSRDEMWKMAEEFNRMGRELGKTTGEITRASVIFYRQGLETNQVLAMVRASTISAAIANTDAGEASNRLTAALRGYNMAASEAMTIADKLAALAARSASSFDELSYAMTKTAASAAVAGIDIDHLYALVA